MAAAAAAAAAAALARRALLEAQFVELTSGPPDRLAVAAASLAAAAGRRDGIVWLLFAPRPITAALARPWLRLAYFAAAAAVLLWCASAADLAAAGAGAAVSARYLRLTAANAGQFAGIVAAGLLRDGQPIAPTAAATAAGFRLNATVLVIDGGEVVVSDGWWLRTAAGSELPPGLSVARESSLDGRVWASAHSPPWLAGADGRPGSACRAAAVSSVPLNPDAAAGGAGGDGTTWACDLSAPWAWILSRVGATAAAALGHLAASVAAAACGGRLGVGIAAFGHAAAAVMRTAAAVGAAGAGQYSDSAAACLWLLVDAGLCWLLVRARLVVADVRSVRTATKLAYARGC